MTNSCVVFTTDPRYLYPTVVAAHSARAHTPLAAADVLILCFGASKTVEQEFAEICEGLDIRFLGLQSEAIEGASAMMARLFLDQLLPEQYQAILYLDSDIIVTGNLLPLLDCKLPAGSFLAANDPAAFVVDGCDRLANDLQEHLASLGFGPIEAREYFNSGVLRFDREGWDAIGMEAWHWFRKNRSTSRFPDQDAINIVSRGHRLRLSLCWNFPAFLQNIGGERTVRPRVHHFMSAPKPWQGNFAPWGHRFSAIYQEPLRRFPHLVPHLHRLPTAQAIRYTIQQRAKQIAESVTWGMSLRKTRILEYEKECFLVC
jgi:lipopolysaccharide biosynthesis glycosyltransferase